VSEGVREREKERKRPRVCVCARERGVDGEDLSTPVNSRKGSPSAAKSRRRNLILEHLWFMKLVKGDLLHRTDFISNIEVNVK
jgi:hypothetical protein